MADDFVQKETFNVHMDQIKSTLTSIDTEHKLLREELRERDEKMFTKIDENEREIHKVDLSWRDGVSKTREDLVKAEASAKVSGRVWGGGVGAGGLLLQAITKLFGGG